MTNERVTEADISLVLGGHVVYFTADAVSTLGIRRAKGQLVIYRADERPYALVTAKAPGEGSVLVDPNTG